MCVHCPCCDFIDGDAGREGGGEKMYVEVLTLTTARLRQLAVPINEMGLTPNCPISFQAHFCPSTTASISGSGHVSSSAVSIA